MTGGNSYVGNITSLEKHIDLETSVLTWKHHYELENISYNLEIEIFISKQNS